MSALLSVSTHAQGNSAAERAFSRGDPVPQWVRAAGPLPAPAAKVDAAVLQPALKAARAASTPSEAVARVLEFIQADIRDLSMSLGQNSHRPFPPEQVLARRYGDCKDKSLLMVAMLNELKIEAVPVLVPTSLRKGLDQFLPGPMPFDHVVVRVVVNGKTYFLDPTSMGLFGELDRMGQLHGGSQVLPIAAGAGALQVIPHPGQVPVAKRTERVTAAAPGQPADWPRAMPAPISTSVWPRPTSTAASITRQARPAARAWMQRAVDQNIKSNIFIIAARHELARLPHYPTPIPLMLINKPRLCLAVFLLFVGTAHAQPSAEANAALSPSHRIALLEIIDNTLLVDTQLEVIKRERVPPVHQEITRHFLSTVTRELAILLTVPVLARFLNEEQALVAAAATRDPDVRAAFRYSMEAKLGNPLAKTALTDAELTRIVAVTSSPAFEQYDLQINHLQPALNESWATWLRFHQRDVAARAAAAIFKGIDAVQSAVDPVAGTPVAIDTVGVSYFDKLIRTHVETARDVNVAERRFAAGILRSGLDQVLLPVNLVDRAGVSRGKAILDFNDGLVATYLREAHEAQKRCEQELQSIEMPDKDIIMAGTDAALLQNYMFMMKFGESQRRVLENYRRFLALAEARAETLTIEDGKLIFPSDADVALAATIIRDIGLAFTAAEELSGNRNRMNAALRPKL